MDQEQICAEMDRVRTDYRNLLDTATVAELRKPTDGTKWNNEQLLFHMLFGYLLVRNLRILVWGFSRLPEGASRRFAALLNAGTRPFHVINYVGSLFGARDSGICPHGAAHGPRAQRPSDVPASTARTCARPRHALPGRLGPLLQGLHDTARRLPLPDPALRPPPAATDPREGAGVSRRGFRTHGCMPRSRSFEPRSPSLSAYDCQGPEAGRCTPAPLCCQPVFARGR